MSALILLLLTIIFAVMRRKSRWVVPPLQVLPQLFRSDALLLPLQPRMVAMTRANISTPRGWGQCRRHSGELAKLGAPEIGNLQRLALEGTLWQLLLSSTTSASNSSISRGCPKRATLLLCSPGRAVVVIAVTAAAAQYLVVASRAPPSLKLREEGTTWPSRMAEKVGHVEFLII